MDQFRKVTWNCNLVISCNLALRPGIDPASNGGRGDLTIFTLTLSIIFAYFVNDIGYGS